MAQLFCRPGDCQALKGLAAAALSNISLDLVTDSQALSVSSTSLGPGTLRLRATNGATVSEPNAIAKLLGPEPSNAEAAVLIHSWLEWDVSTLQPATLLSVGSQQAPALAAALNHLTSCLSSLSGPWLLGEQLSVADVVVYSTLLPLLLHPIPAADLAAQHSTAHTYLTRVGASDAVRSAQEKLLADVGAPALKTVFEQDAAQYQAAQPRLPQPGKRNILITSALPYVNNVPHLGNIIGCVLSADVYARFCRARGYNTVYVCGTDEYGTATETKALEEGLSCAELCDKYHAVHKAIYEWFDIGFDKFGRTPSRAQTSICQAVFAELQAQGCLLEQSMEQLFSEALGKFLADRFVTGTCPKCKYEDARGDQCDQCGTLLNPTELLRPKCKITGTTPVIRSTRHIFLDLPKLSPPLQTYITNTSAQGGWSNNCVQVTSAWMRDGLKPRCITRDLKWGTPVPQPGFDTKVFYVWFDAPIGYISITANYTAEWEQWWKNPKDVELVQFMGKDNVPFHTVIFPATLLGTGGPWTMMRNISVTEYLNYEGGKFSKSRGTGVFGNDAQDTGIPVEVWRYYLLSVRPEQQDTDFKWSDLQARTNSELLANLGNLVNRALQFVVKFFNGVVPAAHPEKGAQALAALGATVGPKVAEYYAAMEAIKLREGIRLAMTISADGNKFIQDNQPWVWMKQDIEHCGSIVAGAVGMVRLVTALVAPYMPSFTKSVLAQMALPPSASDLTDALAAGAFNPQVLAPPAGHVIGKPTPLVTAIPDDLVESLRERFGGSQSERQAKQTAPASAPGLPAKPTPREAAKKATSAYTTSTAGTVATEAL
ncbi:methionine--tRNA ligase, cytoplasmic [Haematococcus lacustris]